MKYCIIYLIEKSCSNIDVKYASVHSKIPGKRNRHDIGVQDDNFSGTRISYRSRVKKRSINTRSVTALNNLGRRQRVLREHHYDNVNKYVKDVDRKRAPVIIKDVIERSKERLKDFERALKMKIQYTTTSNPDFIQNIKKIEEQLNQFGYSLYAPYMVDSYIIRRYSI